MYDYAWRPFFLTHAKDPQAKELFARVLTYFVLVMSVLFLLLSFVIPDVVRIRIFGRYIIHPDYWGGLAIVPVVLLAYVFLGIYNNLIAGIYIEKKTARLPVITFVGAGMNIVANFALIPPLGMMGAAVATLLSYMVMAAVLYVNVQRVYHVTYEFGRLAKIAIATLIVFGCSLLVDAGPYRIAFNLLLLIAFGGLMYWMKFFEPSEVRAILDIFKRRGKVQPTDVAPPDAIV
jgi:O-antigen/teichoic acid export membrane protein